MHAHDRFLPEWFNRIRARQMTLPRFQRHEAWGHGEVSGLLTTVLRGLPSGAALILEVGDEEKFSSRTMLDAPEKGDKVTEQLLDGQQRLTALWRSLHDKYEDRTYLVGYEEDPESPEARQPVVYGQARWQKNGARYPAWVDSPAECWRRGYIPFRLLKPEDITAEIRQWISAAVGDAHEKKDELFDRILLLRDKVKGFNLPYLALPAKTPKEFALDVFVKMNTSSVRLSTYDIVVALVEDETGKSLHEHVDELAASVPRAAAYAELPDLVLDVVALRQDRIPSQAGYRGIDYGRMVADWTRVIDGVRGMAQFLEEEGIYDAQRLPSYTAIPVLAALWEHLPSQPDRLGNARLLLRKYLWRAFLTSRYEQSSPSNALQDYRGLRKALKEGGDAASPIMDRESYPPPSEELVLRAEWPKGNTILGRALLALQLKCGAEDLADGARASVATITSKTQPREYHHLFPASTLEDAGLPAERIFRAANCALITWRTNRAISNKDPVAYLKERAQGNALGEEDLRRRLRTHLIPFKPLAVGYEGLSDAERRRRVVSDYDAFLSARAGVLARVAAAAYDGKSVEPKTGVGDDAA
jgi:hypothetical protein